MCYPCFFSTVAELSHCDRQRVAPKAWNIHSLPLQGKLSQALLYSASPGSPAGLSSTVLACLLTYLLSTSFPCLSHSFIPCQGFQDFLNKWLILTFLTQSEVLGQPTQWARHILVCADPRANWGAEQGPLSSHVNLSTTIQLSPSSHPQHPVSSAALLENSTLWVWLFLVHIFCFIECHLCTRDGGGEGKEQQEERKPNIVLDQMLPFRNRSLPGADPKAPMHLSHGQLFQPPRTWPSHCPPPLTLLLLSFVSVYPS